MRSSCRLHNAGRTPPHKKLGGCSSEPRFRIVHRVLPHRSKLDSRALGTGARSASLKPPSKWLIRRLRFGTRHNRAIPVGLNLRKPVTDAPRRNLPSLRALAPYAEPTQCVARNAENFSSGLFTDEAVGRDAWGQLILHCESPANQIMSAGICTPRRVCA
jgi:hypothetical protein